MTTCYGIRHMLRLYIINNISQYSLNCISQKSDKPAFEENAFEVLERDFQEVRKLSCLTVMSTFLKGSYI